jgi:hypothetical protein
MQLQDAWVQRHGNEVYTHYTPHGASCIDRIYVTQTLLPHKRHTETVAAAFTDHLVVILNMECINTDTVRGNGYCKLSTALLKDEQINEPAATNGRSGKKQYSTIPPKACGGADL